MFTAMYVPSIVSAPRTGAATAPKPALSVANAATTSADTAAPMVVAMGMMTTVSRGTSAIEMIDWMSQSFDCSRNDPL